MKKSDHGLQLGRVECCNAGFELSLQVIFHDTHVSYPDWEHVLIQSVYQGKELIEVLVLESGGVQKRGEMKFLEKYISYNIIKNMQYMFHSKKRKLCLIRTIYSRKLWQPNESLFLLFAKLAHCVETNKLTLVQEHRRVQWVFSVPVTMIYGHINLSLAPRDHSQLIPQTIQRWSRPK